MRIKKSFKLILAAFASLFVLSSCGGNNPNNNQPIDKSSIFTDITNTLKLDRTYEGKDFYNDGIGKAKVTDVRDGDTAVFSLENGSVSKSVVIRFFCIDTPESTGGVEKWGKSASKFTSDILNKTTEIVLEASTEPASKDSYGERYLGFVWYKTKDDTEFKNLNLQIVENGYSLYNNNTTPKYNKEFMQALDFAKTNKLHIHGDDEDPYYSDAATELTVKELNEHPEKYYNMETSTGSKVRFSAYVKSVSVYSDQSTYTVATVIDNVEYTFNVYAGYSSTGISGYIKLGNEYSFTGSVGYRAGSGYQLSGLTYVPLETGGDYLYLVKANRYLTFNSSIEYKTNYAKNLYSDATITKAEIDGKNIKFTTSAVLKQDGKTTQTFTFIVPNDNNLVQADLTSLVGKAITGSGLNDNNTITVLGYTKISIK